MTGSYGLVDAFEIGWPSMDGTGRKEPLRIIAGTATKASRFQVAVLPVFMSIGFSVRVMSLTFENAGADMIVTRLSRPGEAMVFRGSVPRQKEKHERP